MYENPKGKPQWRDLRFPFRVLTDAHRANSFLVLDMHRPDQPIVKSVDMNNLAVGH